MPYLLDSICPISSNDGQQMTTFQDICYWKSLTQGGYYSDTSGIQYCANSYPGGIPIIIDTSEKHGMVESTLCDTNCR